MDTKVAGVAGSSTAGSTLAAVVAFAVGNVGPNKGIDTAGEEEHRPSGEVANQDDTCPGTFRAVACQDSPETSEILLVEDANQPVLDSTLGYPGTAERTARSQSSALTMYLPTVEADQTSWETVA